MGIFSGAHESNESYIRAAIDALRYSEDIDEGVLVCRVYDLALTSYAKLASLRGEPREILDAVFADGEGELADMAVFKSENADVRAVELSLGDIMVFEGEGSSGILIHDGENFVSLGKGGIPCNEYSQARRLAVFRPLRVLEHARKFDFAQEELSEAQTALLATAEAYFMRGYRAQYDDSRFTRVGGGEFRWQIGLRNPEDYTRDKWGYINCAAFTYELYRTALGFDLGSLYTTFNLMGHYSKCGFSEGEPMYPYYYVPNPNADEEERMRVESQFFGTLRVGDLTVVRRSNASGHVLMYIGDGRFVHSTGASYNYEQARETHEPTVLVIDAWDYLFCPSAKNYVFSESGLVTQLGIIRPLDKFSGEITENTRNRVKNLRGIFAEKLSSVNGARTVRIGDEITYTFDIRNLTEKKRSVDICDSIPYGTELVCGELIATGDALSASVTLEARESRSLSYTVRVVSDACDKICDTGATVGGVTHACSEIGIKNTLTDGQRESVSKAAEYFLQFPTSSVGAELVNEIYAKAGCEAFFDSASVAEIEKSLFEAEEFYLLKQGKYASMIPGNLYGGRNLQTENLYSATCKKSSGRIRLPRRRDLMLGDVIIIKNKAASEFYLYTGGDRLLDLTDGAKLDALLIKERLEGLLSAYNYFAVLRS